MRILLGVIVLLLILGLALRASSSKITDSRDPVVIDVIGLRERERESANNLPALAAIMPMGPRPASAFTDSVMDQLPTGPPPPGHRPTPAGTIPGPVPPRAVGQLLNANTGPPTYGPWGLDAYCPI